MEEKFAPNLCGKEIVLINLNLKVTNYCKNDISGTTRVAKLYYCNFCTLQLKETLNLLGLRGAYISKQMFWAS